MIAKASAKFIRISPRKVRYVIDLIRKKRVPEAQGILNGSPRRAADLVRKLLNQAVDAAGKNSHIPARDLFISKVTADGGPTMKRFRAASMGRASVILKRTSHIYLELDTRKRVDQIVPPKGPVKAPTVKAPVQPGGLMRAPKKVTGKKLVGAK